MSTRSQQSGFLLIDALIGVTIASILSVAFLSIIFNASVASTNARERFSVSLTQLEVYEVLVGLSQSNFDAVLTAGVSCPCHIEHDSTTWSIVAGTETIDGFYERSFTISTVERDGSGNIASAGTLDPDTLQLDITTSWNDKGDVKTDTLTAFVHRIN